MPEIKLKFLSHLACSLVSSYSKIVCLKYGFWCEPTHILYLFCPPICINCMLAIYSESGLFDIFTKYNYMNKLIFNINSLLKTPNTWLLKCIWYNMFMSLPSSLALSIIFGMWVVQSLYWLKDIILLLCMFVSNMWCTKNGTRRWKQENNVSVDTAVLTFSRKHTSR